MATFLLDRDEQSHAHSKRFFMAFAGRVAGLHKPAKFSLRPWPEHEIKHICGAKLRAFAFCVSPYRPSPTMNSAVSDSVKGFLNTISASHSERPRLNSLAPPTSISSQSLIALNSTDAEGPKLNFLSGKPHSVAPPSAMIANGSLSSARIFSEDKSKATATPKSAMPLFILPCPRPIP